MLSSRPKQAAAPSPTVSTPAPKTPAEPARGWAAGVVVAKDKTPIPGADVVLSDDDRAFTAKTNPSGQFKLKVPTGDYDVKASARGKQFPYGPIHVETGQVAQIAIGTTLPSAMQVQMESMQHKVRVLQSDNARLTGINTRLNGTNARLSVANLGLEADLVNARRELATRPPVASLPAPPSPVPPSPDVPTRPSPAETVEMPPSDPTRLPEMSLEQKRCVDQKKPCRVEVFFATDRAPRLDERAPRDVKHVIGFKGARSKEQDPMTYGWCEVTIPDNHVKMTGDLKGISYDPQRSLFIAENTDEFLARLGKRIDDDPAREMLVFVHGYKVAFAEAARRTAQLHWDLGFQGAPAFFSWPSRGNVLGYLADEASAEWAAAHLRDFLDMLAQRSGAKRIHLIAHSMGNRPLSQALADLARRDAQMCKQDSAAGAIPRARISQVVMAAPDLDADMFVQLKEAVQQTADRVTIYASRKDRAILGSMFAHHFARLGNPKLPPQTGAKIEAIDATNASTGFLGHSYYGGSILWDVKRVFGKPNEKAIERCTIRQAQPPELYPKYIRQVDPAEKVPGPIKRALLRLTGKLKAEPIGGECKVSNATLPKPVRVSSR